MEYRLKKQLTIGVIFSIFVVSFFISIFLLQKSDASCFDKILNQNEENIDCGGPCLPCVDAYFENIEVLSSNILFFDGAYDVFARIKNPNSRYGTGELRYKIKFYDKNGNFISEKKGKSYILASETKYILESNLDITPTPSFVKFEIEPVNWQEQERSIIKLPIFSKKYETVSIPGSSVISQVTGVIENQTNYSFVDVDVVVVLFDENEKQIAVNQTKINNLRAAERRGLVIPWFSKIDKQVNKVFIEASANVFDDANILR